MLRDVNNYFTRQCISYWMIFPRITRTFPSESEAHRASAQGILAKASDRGMMSGTITWRKFSTGQIE